MANNILQDGMLHNLWILIMVKILDICLYFFSREPLLDVPNFTDKCKENKKN